MSEAALKNDHHQEDQASAYGHGYEPGQQMVPIGAVLAARRQEAQWTVEQVAAHLKLAPRQIEALETGDYGALPGMAVARGFIRSYAKLVMIDPEPYMPGIMGSATLNAMPPSRKAATAVPFSEKQTGSLMGGRNSSRVLMGAGVLLTVVLLASAAVAVQRAGWLASAGESLMSSGGKAVAMMSAKPAGTVAEDAASARLDGMNMTLGEQGVLASAGAPIVPNTPGSIEPGVDRQDSAMPVLTASPMLNMTPAAPVARPETGAAATSAAAPATAAPAATGLAATRPSLPLIQPVTPAPQTDEAAAQSPAASVSKLSSALNGASGASGGVLSLVMREDSWIEIRRADRSAVVSRMFKAGSAETFTLDGPVSVVVGNAHGVDATLRGAPVELRAGNNNIARLNLK